jgi:hypothetical protein
VRVRAAEAGHRGLLYLILATRTDVQDPRNLAGVVGASSVLAGSQKQGLPLTRRDRGEAAVEPSDDRDELLLAEGRTASVLA